MPVTKKAKNICIDEDDDIICIEWATNSCIMMLALENALICTRFMKIHIYVQNLLVDCVFNNIP